MLNKLDYLYLRHHAIMSNEICFEPAFLNLCSHKSFQYSGNSELISIRTTICAPQSGACAGGGFGTLSEQNFQSSAHAALRQRVAGVSNPVGIFTFSFRTIWHDDADVPATEVQYQISDSGLVDAYQKRTLEPTHLISEQFYDNGTKRIAKRRLSEQEVSQLPTILIYFQLLISVHSASIYGSVL